MKYIAIGDIHGRNDLLQRLLSRIRSEYAGTTLLFLGDYVDRGPDSYDVVETIKNEVGKGAIAVRGNHESMMLDYSCSPINSSADRWLINGGRATIKSYQKNEGEYTTRGYTRAFMRHRRFLESLPWFHETDELWASHAPIASDTGKEGSYRKDLDACTWTYQPVSTIPEESVNAFDHGKLSICGHIHRLAENVLLPRIYPHIVYCDTGCGCAPWGPLTAAYIEDGRYVSYIQEVPNL